MSIVTGLGGGIIIFVAAILGLPSELYDAAHIDGADGWREVVYITIPLLTPTILYVLVATTIGALQVFVPIHLLTGGGPAGATLSLAYLIYRYAFVFLRVGYGATAGVALLFITLGLTVLQFNWFRTAVEY
jgi:ABC-type sugar transport system permease subunit